MLTENFIARDKAEALLRWGGEQNPGPWVDHSRTTARAAESIARACGMDSGAAYILGLLHDIGRFEGVRALHHTVAGYQLLKDKGHDTAARICLTHSFSYQNLGAYADRNYDCTEEELVLINTTLDSVVYDDFDKLIQLCDAMALPERVCPMEIRMVDVARRHGFNEFTLKDWESIFALKAYFDKKCGQNIYKLFEDEIKKSLFS
ncbi:phosphohydrolase [Spirochaetia bacterium]|nr:phosphohydrolase [Spirochaetia bacterium]